MRARAQVVNEQLSPNCKARLTVENDDRASLFRCPGTQHAQHTVAQACCSDAAQLLGPNRWLRAGCARAWHQHMPRTPTLHRASTTPCALAPALSMRARAPAAAACVTCSRCTSCAASL